MSSSSYFIKAKTFAHLPSEIQEFEFIFFNKRIVNYMKSVIIPRNIQA